jgi:hypothetical protein
MAEAVFFLMSSMQVCYNLLRVGLDWPVFSVFFNAEWRF